MRSKKEQQIYGISDFICYISAVLISLSGVYQSHTLKSEFWSHDQLVVWQYIWLFFTFVYLIALTATIEKMIEVKR